MASNTWIASGVGWGFIVIGWLMSPAISFLLNKFFSYLDFNTSRKLRELEIDTIPKLKQTLKDAVAQRMMGEAEGMSSKSDLTILDEIMKDLKSALHEAEDILDLVDYHKIDKRVIGHGTAGVCISRFNSCITSWVHHICGATSTRISRCTGNCSDQLRYVIIRVHLLRGAASTWITACKSCFSPSTDVATIQGSSADAVLTPVFPGNIPSADAVSTPVPMQEVSVTIDAGSVSSAHPISSVEEGSTTILSARAVSTPVLTADSVSSADVVSSAEEISTENLSVGHVSTTESVSIVHNLHFWWSCSSNPVSWTINSCGWILTYLTNAVSNVRYWSHEAFGVRSNQEDVMALDSFLHTVWRMRLMKRIQQIEVILNDSRKSHLLNQKSNISENSVSDEIRQNHRRIGLKVFGRDKDLEDICRMLRDGPSPSRPSSSSSKRYSVIGIHGIAGSGKSTLAQYVCDYENELEDNNKKHFDLFMFVNVSSSSSIFRDMLEQITKKKPSDHSCPASLQELMEKLKGRCFLLVLDDVWVNSKHRNELSDLHAVLNCGDIGSVVLVTAQREDAARRIGAEKLIAISDLEEEQYLSLFMHHALQVTSPFDDREHIDIGRKIAQKLHRSPIAAVTVAARLRRNPDISFWKRTANLDVLKETMGALWWSYQQLDADIRRCFAYLSTFPRAYKLQRVELVHMWVAQGFLKTSNEQYEVEDLGQDYFDELLAFSFLQPQSSIRSADYFTIHDLLHELAERVAGSDFFRIVSNGVPKDISPGVRHLFIETNNGAEIAEKCQGLGNLCTLIIKEHYTGTEIPFLKKGTGTNRMQVLEGVFEHLFMRLRKLRVLIFKLEANTKLSLPELKDQVEDLCSKLDRNAELLLPSSIEQMKHLRYLGFHFPGGFQAKLILPSTFSKLYHMQTIDVCISELSTYFSFCEVQLSISDLEGMANLTHLRRLSSWPAFPNVGRLTSLQTLGGFHVKKEQGYELMQLKHLNDLRGTLQINGLGDVGSKEEALEADLASKKRVTELSLSFSEGTKHPDIQAEVLEGLCPPNDLEQLTIHHYRGSRYPRWMLSRQHTFVPKHLSRLKLHGCSRLASFSEGSELLSLLLQLYILYCDWDSLPENMEHLASLQILCIMGCHNMKLLPTLPQSLNNITISYCDVLSRTCLEEGHKNWHEIQRIPRMQILSREKNLVKINNEIVYCSP